MRRTRNPVYGYTVSRVQIPPFPPMTNFFSLLFFIFCLDCKHSLNPILKLVFQFLGAFSEFKRNIIRERQREGIAKAKEKGVYSGRKTLELVEITGIKPATYFR